MLQLKVLGWFDIDVAAKNVNMISTCAWNVFKLIFSSANTWKLDQYQSGKIWLTSKFAAEFDCFL